MSNPVTFTAKPSSDEFKLEMAKMERRVFQFGRANFSRLTEEWVNLVKVRFSPYQGNRNRTGPYSGPNSNASLQNRGGALKSSVAGRVLGTTARSLRAIMRVGSGRAGYARLQEEGGTITPTRKSALTIPVANALTGAGRLKSKAKIWAFGRGYETGFGPTFIHDGMIFSQPRTKRRSRPILLYILATSVKIPPRLGARGTFRFVVNKYRANIQRGVRFILLGQKGAR